MEKRRKEKAAESTESVKEPALKNKRARVTTNFPIKAPETMPRLGTKGTLNWALKQQHCNKFPDGAPLGYLVLTKLTGSKTGTFDNHPIL